MPLATNSAVSLSYSTMHLCGMLLVCNQLVMIALLMLPLLLKVLSFCFQAAALCFQLLNLDGKLSVYCIGLCNT